MAAAECLRKDLVQAYGLDKPPYSPDEALPALVSAAVFIAGDIRATDSLIHWVQFVHFPAVHVQMLEKSSCHELVSETLSRPQRDQVSPLLEVGKAMMCVDFSVAPLSLGQSLLKEYLPQCIACAEKGFRVNPGVPTKEVLISKLIHELIVNGLKYAGAHCVSRPRLPDCTAGNLLILLREAWRHWRPAVHPQETPREPGPDGKQQAPPSEAMLVYEAMLENVLRRWATALGAKNPKSLNPKEKGINQVAIRQTELWDMPRARSTLSVLQLLARRGLELDPSIAATPVYSHTRTLLHQLSRRVQIVEGRWTHMVSTAVGSPLPSPLVQPSPTPPTKNPYHTFHTAPSGEVTTMRGAIVSDDWQGRDLKKSLHKLMNEVPSTSACSGTGGGMLRGWIRMPDGRVLPANSKIDPKSKSVDCSPHTQENLKGYHLMASTPLVIKPASISHDSLSPFHTDPGTPAYSQRPSTATPLSRKMSTLSLASQYSQYSLASDRSPRQHYQGSYSSSRPPISSSARRKSLGGGTTSQSTPKWTPQGTSQRNPQGTPGYRTPMSRTPGSKKLTSSAKGDRSRPSSARAVTATPATKTPKSSTVMFQLGQTPSQEDSFSSSQPIKRKNAVAEDVERLSVMKEVAGLWDNFEPETDIQDVETVLRKYQQDLIDRMDHTVSSSEGLLDPFAKKEDNIDAIFEFIDEAVVQEKEEKRSVSPGPAASARSGKGDPPPDEDEESQGLVLPWDLVERKGGNWARRAVAHLRVQANTPSHEGDSPASSSQAESVTGVGTGGVRRVLFGEVTEAAWYTELYDIRKREGASLRHPSFHSTGTTVTDDESETGDTNKKRRPSTLLDVMDQPFWQAAVQTPTPIPPSPMKGQDKDWLVNLTSDLDYMRSFVFNEPPEPPKKQGLLQYLPSSEPST